jgi:hypothetical protein
MVILLVLFVLSELYKYSIRHFVLSIKSKNRLIKSVNLLSDENMGTLRLLIIFYDHNTILLDKVTKKQNEIIIRACNGYEPIIYIKSREQPIIIRIGNLSLSSTLNNLGISLTNLDDIIQNHKLIIDYMENIPTIESEQFDEMEKYNRWEIESNDNLKEAIGNKHDTIIIRELLPEIYFTDWIVDY